MTDATDALTTAQTETAEAGSLPWIFEVPGSGLTDWQPEEIAAQPLLKDLHYDSVDTEYLYGEFGNFNRFSTLTSLQLGGEEMNRVRSYVLYTWSGDQTPSPSSVEDVLDSAADWLENGALRLSELWNDAWLRTQDAVRSTLRSLSDLESAADSSLSDYASDTALSLEEQAFDALKASFPVETLIFQNPRTLSSRGLERLYLRWSCWNLQWYRKCGSIDYWFDAVVCRKTRIVWRLR